MTKENPVIAIPGVDHGDPAVIQHEGVYYLYHTGPDHVPVYSSENLRDWKYEGKALTASSIPGHWAAIDLWAPELFYENGTFYMYVTGAKIDRDGQANDEERHIGVAVSSHPLGPFRLHDEPLTNEWSIDAHPFVDGDGLLYMFYNVRNEHTIGPAKATGTGNVVDRMLDPVTLAGKPELVVKPEYEHEGNKERTFYWNEGPFVLKHENTYYQMYSAGFFGDDTYGVYYAKSPSVYTGMGYKTRWEKCDQAKPLMETNAVCHGPGHHVVVTGPDGRTPYIVYHGYSPEERLQERRIRIGRLWWEGDKLQVQAPSRQLPAVVRPDVVSRDQQHMPHELPKAATFTLVLEVNVQNMFALMLPEVDADLTIDLGEQKIKWRAGGKGHTNPLPRYWEENAVHHLRVFNQHGKLSFFMNHIQLFEFSLSDSSISCVLHDSACVKYLAWTAHS
ncbi:glycoside hydrolase family 43 protein [Alkalicoccus luteus]|uniref:glycoside hydrolase family 43 protein n=1 Tax=Alkalicoccus luteus TaxID=1237094 RepID=UPI004034E903